MTGKRYYLFFLSSARGACALGSSGLPIIQDNRHTMATTHSRIWFLLYLALPLVHLLLGVLRGRGRTLMCGSEGQGPLLSHSQVFLPS